MDNKEKIEMLKDLAETPETPETTLVKRRKEAIQKLPKFKNCVSSKSAIRKMPDVKIGDIFWAELDEKAYVVSDIDDMKHLVLRPLDETASVSLGMTIYEMNKNAASKEPLLDWASPKAVTRAANELEEFFEKTQNTYYLLYGREIHYVTLLQRENGRVIDLNGLISLIKGIAHVISIDFDRNEKGAVEIWLRTLEEKATLLYLMPFDEGLVKI